MKQEQEELWPRVPIRVMRFRHYGLVKVGGGEFHQPANDMEEPELGTLCHAVLEYYRECRGRGSTDHEGQEAMHIPGDTWRPRRHDLLKMGLLTETLYKRPTPSGLKAKVFKAAEYVRDGGV